MANTRKYDEPIMINLRTEEDLVVELDRLAEQEGVSRTEIINNILKQYVYA